MDINVLIQQSEGSELETLIDGWKINTHERIVCDSNNTIYQYLSIERFSGGYRIINNDLDGFILPGVPGIFKIKQRRKEYSMIENKNKRCMVNLKNKVISNISNEIRFLKVDDGVAYYIAAKENEWKVVRFENKESARGLLEVVNELQIINGVAYLLINGKRIRFLPTGGKLNSGGARI